jgi:hypothetical protein
MRKEKGPGGTCQTTATKPVFPLRSLAQVKSGVRSASMSTEGVFGDGRMAMPTNRTLVFARYLNGVTTAISQQ